MPPAREVVITGVGVVSPIGIGREAFWDSLCRGQSGVRPFTLFDPTNLPVQFAGQIEQFDAKRYVKPRKSLKVMSRDIQFAFAAADLGCDDAELAPGAVDPERFGVVLGSDMMYAELAELASAYRSCLLDGEFHFPYWGQRAMGELFPLLMLKYLPNMPACHIAIAHDARGPNNSITLGEVSSLLAIAEAMRVIERGAADVMIAGGSSSRLHPMHLMGQREIELSHRDDNPAAASRPFDADRDGMVQGEGAATLILESREHAQNRGARVLARVAGYSSTFQPPDHGQLPPGDATRRAIENLLQSTGLRPSDVGHVNAHGVSTIADDQAEAQAIHATLGDVPVTAPKSFFGNLGAGTGAVEAVVSVLGLAAGEVPMTLNFERRDDRCPVNVVHHEALRAAPPVAVLLNQTPMGQSIALALVADGAN